MKDDDERMGSAFIAILVCRVYNHRRFLGDIGFVVFFLSQDFTYIQLIEICFTRLLSLRVPQCSGGIIHDSYTLSKIVKLLTYLYGT